MEWVGDETASPSWVVVMSAVTSGTVLLVGEVWRAVTGVAETSTVGEARAVGVAVSVTPEVVGVVGSPSVE